MRQTSTTEWWEEAFGNAHYPLPSLAFSWEEKSRKEFLWIRRLLCLPKCATVLDVACGVGRHSIPLAQAGFGVTGIDISPTYLKLARKSAKSKKVAARFIQRDMRKLDFHEEFDAAVNLFSSFGYFSSPKDDERVLGKIFKALKPGGTFLLDNMNPPFIQKHFASTTWCELPDGTLMLEARSPIINKNIATSKWVFVSKSGRRRQMNSSIRLYGRDDFTRLLKRIGFSPIKNFGSLSGEPYRGSRSNRLVILARKPRYA